LPLAEELVAPHLFISMLILIYAWALSGPETAAILSALSALIVFYVCLGSKDLSIFLQLFVYGAIFSAMFSFLFKIQKKINNREIEREKLSEEIHLAEEAAEKKVALKKALDQKIDRFLGLRQFSETLKDIQELHGASQAVVLEAQRFVPRAEECALYMVDEAKQELYLVAGVSRNGEAVRQKQGTLFDQWAMKRSQALIIEDSRNDFRFPAEKRSEGELLVSVCVSPLITENRVLGVMRVNSSQVAAFTSDDLRLLDILSSLGAVMLRNRLLHEKMEELAIRDSLTGLYVNRYFQERLAEEIMRANLKKGIFTVLMLDIDFFKRINDEFGHTAGDLVLKNVASSILGSLDTADLAARYGGEEFVILLPDTGAKPARERAERIRAHIEKSKFYLRRAENRVTASIGVAVFPADGRTKEEIIRAVDRNLYQAKKTGRNRVCGGAS
jgi:diguanylate cyclase (GGDEF)-like protein